MHSTLSWLCLAAGVHIHSQGRDAAVAARAGRPAAGQHQLPTEADKQPGQEQAQKEDLLRLILKQQQLGHWMQHWSNLDKKQRRRRTPAATRPEAAAAAAGGGVGGHAAAAAAEAAAAGALDAALYVAALHQHSCSSPLAMTLHSCRQ
jgi:hypothetical protein